MTARQFIDIPGVKLAVYGVLIGIAWASLRAEVSQKADKATVEAMAENIRDIKSILCQDNTDSFCNSNPRE